MSELNQGCRGRGMAAGIALLAAATTAHGVVNTTVQDGRININHTFQCGASATNDTVQSGRVNVNHTVQRCAGAQAPGRAGRTGPGARAPHSSGAQSGRPDHARAGAPQW